jgi:NCS1 family nucleobase:cation symporter-1
MFLLAVSIFATYLITAAPYVADYSRYLPENTSIASTFWYTYLGGVISSIWLCGLGAFLYIAIPEFSANFANHIADLWHLPFPAIIYLTIVFGLVLTMPMSIYGVFMSTISTFEPFTKIKGTKKAKITIMSITVIIAMLIDIFGTSNFLSKWGYFMAIILYFMIPWTSINLVDFYFVRRGNYSIEAMFDPDGIYGRFNWKALFTYVATILIQVPFMSTPFYVGSVANAMGGADIAWIVGLIFSSILYYAFNRKLAAEQKIKDAQ